MDAKSTGPAQQADDTAATERTERNIRTGRAANLPFLFSMVIFTRLLCHNFAPRTRGKTFITGAGKERIHVLDEATGNLIR